MTAQQGTRRMSSQKFSDLNVHHPKILPSREMKYKRTTKRNVRQRSDKKSENQDTQRCTTIGHICQTNYQSNATIVQSYMLYSPTEARWIKVTKENDQVRNQNAKAKTDSTIYHGNTVKAECCEEIRSKVNMETSPDHSSHHGDPGRSHNCLTQHATSHNISTSETQLPLLIGHDFAGIDLWRHGLHTVLKRPLRYVFASETSAWMRAKLRRWYPECRLLHRAEDTVNCHVDIYVGSPPCPPYSTLGRRSFRNRDEGRLCDLCVNRIKACQPKFFCLENVANFAFADGGKYLEQLLHQLAESSLYTIRWDLLDPREHAGLPQSRRRVFVTGWLRTFGTDRGPRLPSLPMLPLSGFIDSHLQPACCDRRLTARQTAVVRRSLELGSAAHSAPAAWTLACDPDCSVSFASPAAPWCPCLLHRGKRGHWLATLGRRLHVTEAARLQGILLEELDLPADMRTMAALGNGVCAGVVARLCWHVIHNIFPDWTVDSDSWLSGRAQRRLLHNGAIATKGSGITLHPMIVQLAPECWRQAYGIPFQLKPSKKWNLNDLDSEVRKLRHSGQKSWRWLKDSMPHNTWSRLGCSVRYSRIPTTLNGALLQNIHRHAQNLLPTGWSACALWIGCVGIPSFRTEERNTSHFGPCLCVG